MKALQTLVTVGALAAFAPVQAAAAQDRIAITVENLAPSMGTFQTPVWIGVHNGSFNMYDRGVPMVGPDSPLGSDALERLAEDGITGGLAQSLLSSGAGLVEGTMPGPSGPIAPGHRAYRSFQVNPASATSRYLSYASMVLPSNDAFIANGNPTGHPIYSPQGQFIFRDFISTDVLDGGTEENDELPANTAFLAQMAPNTGVTTNAGVALHPGFKRPGEGGILDLFNYRNGDFTRVGYSQVMVRIRRAEAIVDDRTYWTLATGAQEVPAVTSPGSVRAAFLLGAQGTELTVRMERRMLENIVGIHLHMGTAGENGPVVLSLEGPSAPGAGAPAIMTTETLFSGADLTGPLADYPLDALIAQMEAGNIYLNVHTSDGDNMTNGEPGDNPSGEVRGQLGRL